MKLDFPHTCVELISHATANERLASSIGGVDNLPVFLNILFKQVRLEKKKRSRQHLLTTARERVLEKGHAIRGFLFFLSERNSSYGADVNPTSRTERNGTRASVPYRRIGRAVENHDLLLFYRRV